MKFSAFAVLAFTTLSLLPLATLANETLDLSGRWVVKLDPESQGEKKHWHRGFSGTAIEMPGICTEAGLGQPFDVELDQGANAFLHLYQRRSYIGAAWYQRDFELPESFHNREALLKFERVLWKSKVWINGGLVGTDSSLSTAHQFSTGGLLRVGKNRIVVCVDNREQVPMGKLSHAYTEQTQTIWNGLLGSMQIEAMPAIAVQYMKVDPEPGDGVINVAIDVNNRTYAPVSVVAKIAFRRLGEDATESQVELELEIPAGRKTVDVELPAENLKLWSEFSPNLYEVFCELGEQRVGITTGFRTLKVEQSKILINGQHSFMRGTLDCCIFPKTGYPPLDVDAWLKRFKVAKSYGLNHIRFHSWCPPEAAFTAADRLGLCLQIELPNWTAEMGQNEQVNQFLGEEGERIFRSYAHHPSFMFFSLGNELKGDFEFMDQLLSSFQSMAKHVLMTSTSFSFSNRGSEPGAHDQFFITQRTASGWVRGQGFFNQNQPETQSDFQSGVFSVSRPLISHEIGQYSIYPSLDEIEKYDGNLRSSALESIRADLGSKNRLADARLATENSGKLALTLYKEEIERAIRTPGQDGFQLLSLTDFSGQSTATVGILDAFWDSKGLIEPKEFRNFCSPTVPLLRIGKRCYRSSETLKARVEVGHFGQRPMKDTDWQVIIKRQDETLFRENMNSVDVAIGNATEIGEFEFSLNQILHPCRLTVSVVCSRSIIENHWSVWIFPDADQPIGDVKVFNNRSPEMLAVLKRGGSVLFLPERDSIRQPIDGRFVPVFWSPLHFPDQSPTHGTIIEKDHPVFHNFPTDSHTDWQWWELLAKSTSVDMSAVTSGQSPPIMRFIDKFNRNALPAILWEAKIGKGKLFVCTLDIETELHQKPVAKALRNSILAYMNGNAFDPAGELTESQLETLFK